MLSLLSQNLPQMLVKLKKMTENIIPRSETSQNTSLTIEKTFQLEKNSFELLRESIKITHDDCLLALDKIESNSIDCVITDPPYFLDGMENN